MEERYHATTQNRFYPDMSNVNRNITVEAKLISPPTYFEKPSLPQEMSFNFFFERRYVGIRTGFDVNISIGDIFM